MAFEFRPGVESAELCKPEVSVLLAGVSTCLCVQIKTVTKAQRMFADSGDVN